MTTNQLDAMAGAAVNRGRIGWAVDWPSGYTSAMPNEATAKACAAAPDLLASLVLAESSLSTYAATGAFTPGQPSGWLLQKIRTAIASATTPQLVTQEK